MIQMLRFFLICAFIQGVVGSHILFAREPYRAKVTVNFSSASVSASNLVDLNRELKSSSIQHLIPFYTPISASSIHFNFRGVLALSSFAENSTTLFVQIPQAEIVKSFTGSTREESLQLFKEFIRDAGDRSHLLKAYAKYSPIDPIAGNPYSLMAQMSNADYKLARLSPLAGCSSCWSAQPIIHQFQMGTIYGRGFSKGFDLTALTLPLRYSYSPSLSWAFLIDAPLSFNITGGAYSLIGSLGVGLQLPLTSQWLVTPLVRVGAGGSLDLCTAGDFFSTGLTSTYNYPWNSFVFSLCNYAAYLTNANLWLSGVNFNYHLQSYVFKNGLTITSCKGLTVYKRPLNYNISYVNTYFTKHRLYIRDYHEVSASLIAERLNPYLCYDNLSLGFTYQWGQQNFKGYNLYLDYRF